jgi:hypothetical protein
MFYLFNCTKYEDVFMIWLDVVNHELYRNQIYNGIAEIATHLSKKFNSEKILLLVLSTNFVYKEREVLITI